MKDKREKEQVESMDTVLERAKMKLSWRTFPAMEPNLVLGLEGRNARQGLLVQEKREEVLRRMDAKTRYLMVATMKGFLIRSHLNWRKD